MYTDEYYELVDQTVASGRGLSRPQAAAVVRRLRPDLCSVAGGGAGMHNGGSAEAELDRLARAVQHEHRGLTYAEAYARALRANAGLYVRYLEEHAAQIGPGARHG